MESLRPHLPQPSGQTYGPQQPVPSGVQGVATKKVPPLGTGTTFYSPRHTFGIVLLKRGEYPKIVPSLLGHASKAQSMDAYFHLLGYIGGDAVGGLDETFVQRVKRSPRRFGRGLRFTRKLLGDRRGSNPRPSGPQPDALPTELRSPGNNGILPARPAPAKCVHPDLYTEPGRKASTGPATAVRCGNLPCRSMRTS